MFKNSILLLSAIILGALFAQDSYSQMSNSTFNSAANYLNTFPPSAKPANQLVPQPWNYCTGYNIYGCPGQIPAPYTQGSVQNPLSKQNNNVQNGQWGDFGNKDRNSEAVGLLKDEKKRCDDNSQARKAAKRECDKAKASNTISQESYDADTSSSVTTTTDSTTTPPPATGTNGTTSNATAKSNDALTGSLNQCLQALDCNVTPVAVDPKTKDKDDKSCPSTVPQNSQQDIAEAQRALYGAAVTQKSPPAPQYKLTANDYSASDSTALSLACSQNAQTQANEAYTDMQEKMNDYTDKQNEINKIEEQKNNALQALTKTQQDAIAAQQSAQLNTDSILAQQNSSLQKVDAAAAKFIADRRTELQADVNKINQINSGSAFQAAVASRNVALNAAWSVCMANMANTKGATHTNLQNLVNSVQQGLQNPNSNLTAFNQNWCNTNTNYIEAVAKAQQDYIQQRLKNQEAIQEVQNDETRINNLITDKIAQDKIDKTDVGNAVTKSIATDQLAINNAKSAADAAQQNFNNLIGTPQQPGILQQKENNYGPALKDDNDRMADDQALLDAFKCKGITPHPTKKDIDYAKKLEIIQKGVDADDSEGVDCQDVSNQVNKLMNNVIQ